MHEPEGLLTALALGIALCGTATAAQPEAAGSQSPVAQPPHRDAAQKAREGDIGHWIEYYRSQGPGGAAPAREQKPQPSPAASPEHK